MYTVIIPSRPDEPYLTATLDSLANQTVAAQTVIVVVNGPEAEGAPAALAAHRHQLTPTVITTRTAGMSNALGLGIAQVDSRYVTFLDADDLWPEDRMEGHLKVLTSESSADAVTGGTVNFREQEDGRWEMDSPKYGRLFGATSFNRSVFQRVGSPDACAGHFTWLYRWWSRASDLGIRVQVESTTALLRRVHGANGWIEHNEHGRRELLAELRRLSRSKNAVP